MVVQLQGGRDAPARAREFIARIVAHTPGPPPDGDLQLLVSELVTNAVIHGGADGDNVIRLEAELAEERIRVSVSDPGTATELVASAPLDPRLPGGWGLALVEELADRWGMTTDPITRVWFEFVRRQPPR